MSVFGDSAYDHTDGRSPERRLECRGACEREAAHRAGEKAVEAVERIANAEIDRLRSERNLLAEFVANLDPRRFGPDSRRVIEQARKWV